MVKMILGNYFVNFIPSLKENVKNDPNKQQTWFYGYFPVIMVINTLNCLEDSMQIVDIIKYIVLAVLLSISILISEIFPNRLEKCMYLCPMSEKERKKYLVTAYWIRIIFNWSIFVLTDIVFTLLSESDYYIKTVVIRGLAYLATLISLNLSVDKTVCDIEKKKNNKALSGIVVCRIAAVVTYYMILLASSEGLQDITLSVILMSICLIIILIITGLSIFCYFNRVMSAAQNYEKSFVQVQAK